MKIEHISKRPDKQMFKDAERLANGERCRVDWISGSGIQPPEQRKRVIREAITASIFWLAVGILAGVQI